MIPSEAVTKAEVALRAAEMAGMVEEVMNNRKEEVARRKELKQRPAGKHLDAAKAALIQVATLVTQMKSGGSSSRSKGRPGENNTACCIPRVPEVSGADAERVEGTSCGRDREGCIGGSHGNRRSDGCCNTADETALGPLDTGKETGIQRAQNTVSTLKERNLYTKCVPLPGEQQDEEMEGPHETLTPTQEERTRNGRGRGTQSIDSGEEAVSMFLPGRNTNASREASGGWKGTRPGHGLRGAWEMMRGLGGQELNRNTVTETHTWCKRNPETQKRKARHRRRPRCWTAGRAHCTAGKMHHTWLNSPKPKRGSNSSS